MHSHIVEEPKSKTIEKQRGNINDTVSHHLYGSNSRWGMGVERVYSAHTSHCHNRLPCRLYFGQGVPKSTVGERSGQMTILLGILFSLAILISWTLVKAGVGIGKLQEVIADHLPVDPNVHPVINRITNGVLSWMILFVVADIIIFCFSWRIGAWATVILGLLWVAIWVSTEWPQIITIDQPSVVEVNTVNGKTEESLRPQTFGDVVGQESSKAILAAKVKAFKKTGRASGHILLLGAAGIGKTTLARVTANEMGVGFHEIMVSQISKWEDIVQAFRLVKPNDIIFMDEIHAAKSPIQEKLYSLMEDFTYSYLDKNGHVQRQHVPSFTLIGATTHAGKLTEPLRNRFGLTLQLEPYTKDELAIIITKAARRAYGLDGLPVDVINKMASISNKNARNAANLLKNLMEFAEARVNGKVQASDLTVRLLKELLRLQGIDPWIGLERSSRRYLVALLAEGKPMGLNTLSSVVDEAPETILEVIEPALLGDLDLPTTTGVLSCPLVKKTPNGRVATEEAKQYIQACGQMQQRGWFPNEKLSVTGY
jgi:Holliday junction DNA helicase RuvB